MVNIKATCTLITPLPQAFFHNLPTRPITLISIPRNTDKSPSVPKRCQLLQRYWLQYGRSSFAHHIRLGGEFLCLQTLDGHPLDRQLSLPVILNTVILLIKNISGHAEVCHLDCIWLVQPKDTKRNIRNSMMWQPQPNVYHKCVPTLNQTEIQV